MKRFVPVEYKGIRVLSNKQVSQFFGLERTRVTTLYSNNRKKFAEGVHYFRLIRGQLEEYKMTRWFQLLQQEGQSKIIGIMYLWTLEGVTLLTKLMKSDNAKATYDVLVENYFKKSA